MADNNSLDKIKKDLSLFDKVLGWAGYSFERKRLVKGITSYVYKMPQQKTGCFYIWEKNDATVSFKDYSPYLNGASGTIIDFVMQIKGLSQTKEGVKEAIKTIKDIGGIVDINDYKNIEKNDFLKKIKVQKGERIKESPFKCEITKKSTYFSMDKLEQYVPVVANYLKDRKIKDFTKLEVYTTKMKYEDKEWKKTYFGIPYGFSLIYNKNKEALKEIPHGVELRDPNLKSKMKTLSYISDSKKDKIGKTPSFFLSTNRQNLLIFESVVDYLSVQKKLNSYNDDIIILNGTGLSNFLVESMLPEIYKIDKEKLKAYENITIFQQNDMPGKVASLKIIDSLANNYLNSNFFITVYKDNETGYDINDLLLKTGISPDEVISERISVFDANLYKKIYGKGVKEGKDVKEIAKNIDEVVMKEIAKSTFDYNNKSRLKP